MKDGSESSGVPGPARRGQVVQRVIVDGWTAAEAASAAGLDERSVARWVADYRRRGMASLREEAGAPYLRQRLLLWLRTLRRGLAPAQPPANASPLRLSREDRG